jgi:hypothetical protein
VEITSGEKTQVLTVAVSETDVVARVSTPRQTADPPKAIADHDGTLRYIGSLYSRRPLRGGAKDSAI